MTPNVHDLLSADELADVRKRSDLRGIWCVAHAWLVIVAAMAAFIVVPHPAVWAIGIVVVGARQLGLAILMHDAAHGVLTNNKRLNDALGQWFCAWPVFTRSLCLSPLSFDASSLDAAGERSGLDAVGAVSDHEVEPVA